MDAAGAGCTVGQGRAAGPSLAWPSGARQNTALTHGWGEREAVVLGARGTPRGEQHGANGTKSTHGDSSLQRHSLALPLHATATAMALVPALAQAGRPAAQRFKAAAAPVLEACRREILSLRARAS